MTKHQRCPDCGKKLRWKHYTVDRCKCGFEITMEFIMGGSIGDFFGGSWEWDLKKQ